jgi:hypothetical protein
VDQVAWAVLAFGAHFTICQASWVVYGKTFTAKVSSLAEEVLNVIHGRVRAVATIHARCASSTVESRLECSCGACSEYTRRVSSVSTDDGATIRAELHRVGLNELVAVVGGLWRMSTQAAHEAFCCVTIAFLAIVAGSVNCFEAVLACRARPAIFAVRARDASFGIG